MEVPSMGWEDPLEEGMANHSNILAWRIVWTEKPGGLQSIGSQSDMTEVTQQQQRSLQDNQRYKGNFHAKTITIKDRNGMDLTEAEDIKKRWQEYTDELHKIGLNDPDSHNGVIIHLEADILGCEVKWAFGSITMNKAS